MMLLEAKRRYSAGQARTERMQAFAQLLFPLFLKIQRKRKGAGMTPEDFKEATSIMFDALAPYQGQEKLRAFCELFKTESIGELRAASIEAAQTLERFPVPRTFRAILDSHRKAPKLDAPKPPCDLCLGAGTIHARDSKGGSWAYRCDCAHAVLAYPSWKRRQIKDLTLEPIYLARMEKREDEVPF